LQYISRIKKEAMKNLNIYLNFNGNCEEAFLFYKSVLGGEFPYIGRYKEMPQKEGCDPMPEELGNRIMHISLVTGNGFMIMGSDTGGDWAPNFQMGNNFAISITAESKEEADRIFNGLSQGGIATMPLQDTFWGDYFGMCTDKFGVNWMISFATGKPM
jgi:PhnB protein